MTEQPDQQNYNSPVMDIYLFVNPASGGYSANHFDHVLHRLKSHGHAPEVFKVRTPGEVLSCCAAVNAASDPLVIVAAGDGTFNSVINGLQPEKATLAVLPFGTSNVLAAEIGISSIDDGVTRIISGKRQPFSIGLLELNNLSRRFALMAGIGLDGAVVRDVLPFAKKHLKQGAYALSAARQSMTWDRKTFEISTPHENLTCHSAIICNGSRYGGNFVLIPGRSIFSPGFEAVCIKDNRRRTYLRLALDLFQNQASSSKNLTRLSAEYVEFKGNAPIQIDGDFVGYGPGRVIKLENFARIIV